MELDFEMVEVIKPEFESQLLLPNINNPICDASQSSDIKEEYFLAVKQKVSCNESLELVQLKSETLDQEYNITCDELIVVELDTTENQTIMEPTIDESSHTDDKPYRCMICSLKFIESYNLKRHMRTHTEIKSFQCTVCHSIFPRYDNLRDHMYYLHKSKKDYQCKICNNKYSSKYHLKRHEGIHTRETSVQCNSSITQNFNMDPPFQCKICKTRFTRMGDLSRHMNTHAPEKPFQCNMCDSKFSQSVNLVHHMRRHFEKRTVKIEEICFVNVKQEIE